MRRANVAESSFRPGWQRQAWLEGNWTIASGAFFHAFRHDVHVIKQYDPARITEWVAGMDYGFTHYTVVLLAGRDDAADALRYVVATSICRCYVRKLTGL